MTRVLALGFVATLALPPPTTADDLTDLKAAHETMIKLLNARDYAAWNTAFFDKEVRFTPNNPFPIDTEKSSRGAGPDEFPYDYWSTSGVNLQYRVIGNTGLVWGYHRDVFKPKDGQLQSLLHRSLLVYVKVDGKWLRAATHQSAVPNGNW